MTTEIQDDVCARLRDGVDARAMVPRGGFASVQRRGGGGAEFHPRDARAKRRCAVEGVATRARCTVGVVRIPSRHRARRATFRVDDDGAPRNEKRECATRADMARAPLPSRDGATANQVDDVSYHRRGTPTTARASASARRDALVATDDRGRRRFHGAFTGGFSAGHFNTVGSVEGFTPRSFATTRADARGKEARAQSVVDFMDDDERAEYEATTLRASAAYDTFGEGAREAHRELAWNRTRADGGAGTSAALGRSDAVADLVAPTESGVGTRLLRRMGWRRGREMRSGRAVGADGFVCVDSASGVEAPAYVIDPKNDRRGVGYDAFAGAEEFRAAAGRNRLAKERENTGLTRGRARGEAFGVGAFEEEDECLYTEDEPKLNEYAFELAEEEDDFARDGGRRRASGAVLALGASTVDGCLVRGFRVSNDTIAPPKWFEPPVVPRDFQPRGVRIVAAMTTFESMAAAKPALPPEAPPPRDAERRKVIDTLATFVAKHGTQFEDMARARQGEEDEKFSFLFGGRDSGYYKWRVAQAKLEHAADSAAPPDRRSRPLGMEERARMLGEKPLPTSHVAAATTSSDAAMAPRQKLSIEGIASDDRARIQNLLSKTFTSGGVVESAKVEKVGLHTLDKTAPKTIVPPKELERNQPSEASHMPIIASRNTIEWAPEPLLCKRFGIADPYANRARPDTAAYKFRSDAITLNATSAKARENAPKYLDVPPPPETSCVDVPPPLRSTTTREVPPPPPTREAAMVEVPPPPPPPKFVEKPMGLFKAIFEDSDDDLDAEEEENETEADVGAIKAALAAKMAPPPPAAPPPPPVERPMWSSAVMAKPRASSERERESSKSKRKRSKKEKKSKKHRSKDSKKHRKHRKSSRRDYDSSSSSSSDSAD